MSMNNSIVAFLQKQKACSQPLWLEREHDSDSTTVAASAWDSHSAEMSFADISPKPCCFGTLQQKRAVRPGPLASTTQSSQHKDGVPEGRPTAWRMSPNLTLLSNRGGPWPSTDQEHLQISAGQPTTCFSFAVPVDQLTRTSPTVSPS